MVYLFTSPTINGTPVSIQGITDTCDEKQNELEGILALANEMHEYGVSEEAGQKIDEDMDQLKEGWVRLCEKLESVHIEVNQIVGWWKEYHEVRELHVLTYVHMYTGFRYSTVNHCIVKWFFR